MLEGLSAPPPPPTNRGNSAAGTGSPFHKSFHKCGLRNKPASCLFLHGRVSAGSNEVEQCLFSHQQCSMGSGQASATLQRSSTQTSSASTLPADFAQLPAAMKSDQNLPVCAASAATPPGPRLASRGQASGCSTPTSGSLSGQQTAPPFSAPPAAAFASAGAAAGGQDGPPYSATRPGYSSIGSTSSGSNAARRALFNGAGGLQVQGASAAAAAPGAGSLSGPGSPTLSSSSSRRRSTAAGLADSSRGLGSPTAACSASGSPAGCGGVAPGGVGGVSERRLSGGCPAGLTGPMSPELQEAVEQV